MRNRLDILLEAEGEYCECLGYRIQNDTMYTDCDECFMTFLGVTADNLHPVQGCGNNRDKTRATAVFRGGCLENAPPLIVRATFRDSIISVVLDENGKIVSNYFTHLRPLTQGFVELYAVVDPNNPNSAPKKISLEDNETDTIIVDFIFDSGITDFDDFRNTGISFFVKEDTPLAPETSAGSTIEPYYAVQPTPG